MSTIVKPLTYTKFSGHLQMISCLLRIYLQAIFTVVYFYLQYLVFNEISLLRPKIFFFKTNVPKEISLFNIVDNMSISMTL